MTVNTLRRLSAWVTDPQRRAALELELADAKRASELRARLVALADQDSAAAVTDPVIARVTAVTGLPVEAMNVWSGVAFAMLLEVLGSLLWVAALGVLPASSRMQPDDSATVERLYEALEAGRISPTAEGIRKFLGERRVDEATTERLLRGLELRMEQGR